MKRYGLIALAAAAALVAVVVAAAQLAGDSSGGAVSDDATELAVRMQSLGSDVEEQPAARPANGLAEGYATDAADGVPSFATGGPVGGAGGVGSAEGEVAPPLPDVAGRKLVRNASVTLEVEDVAAAVQKVETIAAGSGGFVSASSVFVDTPPEPLEDSVEQPRTQSATVTIRVPSDTYATVLNQLRGMADEVRSESSDTADVTEEFTDLDSRLRNLEATEAQYLALLEKAVTIPDILTLQDRINGVRLEIERIQGRMNLLSDLSDLATIVVQLQPPALVAETPSEAGWARQVWDDAWEASTDAMEVLGTAAIVSGVVLAWLAVPALAIGIGWRLFGPRRKEGGEAGESGTPV